MSLLLAIDTATEACSAALWQDGAILSRYQVAPRGHTELILPMVQELLAEAGVTLAQLDGLAFGRGPGSFTGVRITLGVAQGLAFGADLPLVGVSNLQALAQGAHRHGGCERVLAAIDARMDEIYVGGFALEQGVMIETLPEQVLAPKDFLAAGDERWQQGAGSGFVTYPDLTGRVDVLCEAVPFPEARDMLPAALQDLAAGKGVSAAEARPVYLRDKVTWQKLPGR
ncbi:MULTISPECIES: tRNA (adenosine(37)-N6)-threonylcarbamoyltransferase complex dimerization subunit type 1 TsaB [Oceanimonas]|uniref:tRNA threonylcarbamoyladenosine biosynthesis protein TsaB n=1 Tax=Oceanimonas doudoroffii TaxID=84158 RepID=A0A233RGM9_9GAMM|nr:MULTISPECIES: tRNA (adenosine(37)-N6)-threonylcarbamoyltransferase complex dimerization subunit type 1 TsaB [Oceanimonas]NHI00843.1 tRNA threonylcarbamoyladenosine biosynthesis protein TsaB [Oceanimonas sp. MB9]OXY82550.1 tRNA (adenosine(37)-N6)-threonylcarbamoyltransferase complex dimerization subunit type 1 TsaB [Oceanimonas doudoroffii]